MEPDPWQREFLLCEDRADDGGEGDSSGTFPEENHSFCWSAECSGRRGSYSAR